MKPYGYYPEKFTPCLWLHKTRKTTFTLVVNNFSVKYNNQEDLQDLIKTLSNRYTITNSLSGSLYVGVTMQWDYINIKVRCLMTKYIPKLLEKYNYLLSGNTQYSPHPEPNITYGAKVK